MNKRFQNLSLKKKETEKSKLVTLSARPETFVSKDLTDIEILEIREVDGHVEVFVRASKNGQPIGFGRDGSVEIERIRIKNPPLLVPDPVGTVEIKSIDSVTGKRTVQLFREDPAQALRDVVSDAIRLIGKSGENIIKGKRGRTTTIIYASSTDGVFGVGEGAWDPTHDATSGAAFESTNIEAGGYKSGTVFSFYRGFTPFDTSILGSDTIISATVSLYPTLIKFTDNDGDDWVNVVQATVADPASPVAEDFDQIGAINNPTEGSTRIDISSSSTGAYLDWLLNATGLTWINGAGITQLGWREGHDALDLPYAGADGNTRMRFSPSEATGTTQDPKLTIEHVVSAIEVADDRLAEVRGSVATNAVRAAEVRGQATTNDIRSTEVTGSIASYRAAEVRGTNNNDDTRAAEVSGALGDNSDRTAEVRGETTTNNSRAAEARGQNTTNDDQASEVTGIEGANSTRLAEITGAEQAHKTLLIKAYTSAGAFLGVIADASFDSFTKRIDEGLGECLFRVARKFDESMVELLEGNLIEIFISDKETIIYDGTDNTGVRRVYQGRIVGLSLKVQGGRETLEVRCMGHWVSLGLDGLKNAAQTTLYTRTTGGVGTTATAESVDIGSVVRGILDRYIAETTNSPISYTTDSVPTVGSNMNYIFRQRTYREAIQKCLDTAPYGYYSYVDENGVFSFKTVSTTPDHRFYFQKHFADIDIQRGISKTRNFLLLWAPPATAYKDYSDGESILRYGRQIERVTDSNIQDTTTMDLIGARFIAQNKDIEVRITARIIDSNGNLNKGYDIEDISPGDVVTFHNFDSSISSILRENMIVTEVVWTLNYADITVEPVRLTSVADITSRLKQQISEEKTMSGTTPIPDSYT